MKTQIKTIYGQSGTYLKADRNSDYSILVRLGNGKRVFLRTWEIAEVLYRESKMTAEKFCSLLLIPFKSSLVE